MAANTYWLARGAGCMRSRSIDLVAILFCWCASATAQATPDLYGMWIVQDPGSGNWSEWFNNVTRPALRPEIVQENEAFAAREAAGAVVNRAERLASCPFGNLPMMMASSPPLNIVQSRDEVLMGAEANRGRFIYDNGRRHPVTKTSDYLPNRARPSVGHGGSNA